MFKRLASLSSVVGAFTLAVYLSSDRSTAEQGDPPVAGFALGPIARIRPHPATLLD